MTKLSFFVTSTACYVSLKGNDVTCQEALALDGKTQASVLIPCIKSVLDKAGNPTISQINVPKGPGSFTSLRVTLAAAQGLSLAFPKARCYAPTFFDVLLYTCPHTSYAVIDSKRGDFFVKQQRIEPEILSPDAFAHFRNRHQNDVMIVDPDLQPIFPDAYRYDPKWLLDVLNVAETFVEPSDFSPYYLFEPHYKKLNDPIA